MSFGCGRDSPGLCGHPREGVMSCAMVCRGVFVSTKNESQLYFIPGFRRAEASWKVILFIGEATTYLSKTSLEYCYLISCT